VAKGRGRAGGSPYEAWGEALERLLTTDISCDEGFHHINMTKST